MKIKITTSKKSGYKTVWYMAKSGWVSMGGGKNKEDAIRDAEKNFDQTHKGAIGFQK